MRIFVKAKVRTRKQYLEVLDETHIVVAVSEPPVDGKANLAITRLLAQHFQVPRRDIVLLSGKASSRKVFAIKNLSKLQPNFENFQP